MEYLLGGIAGLVFGQSGCLSQFTADKAIHASTRGTDRPENAAADETIGSSSDFCFGSVGDCLSAEKSLPVAVCGSDLRYGCGIDSGLIPVFVSVDQKIECAFQTHSCGAAASQEELLF